MAEEAKKEYWKPSVTADVVVVDSRLAKHRDDGTFIVNVQGNPML